jgi:hypothetical protein
VGENEEPMIFDIERTDSAVVHRYVDRPSARHENIEMNMSSQLPLEVIDFDSSSEDYDSDF